MDAETEASTSRPGSLSEHGRFLERVDLLKKGRGNRAYGAALGVSENTIRRLYEGGETTRPTLLAMADEGQCSLDWLIAGRGPMRPWGAVNDQTPDYNPDLDFVEIPRYDVEIAAGFGTLVDSERQLPPLKFRADWIRAEGWNPDNLILATAKGYSLPGLVDDGRPVLIDRSQTSISADGVYVARLDGHLIIKKMQREPGGVIHVISTNPEYRDFQVRPDDPAEFVVIGRAVWSDRRL